MTATTKPGDHAARARKAAVERIRRDLPKFTGRREKANPETQDLLAGYEFPGGSAASDMDRQIRFWTDERCPHKTPQQLLKPMERLQEFPSKKTAKALRAAILRFEAAADKDTGLALFATRQCLRELAERCDVWAAEWGDPEAAGRCASKAYKAWTYTATGYAWASMHGWGLIRQWIAYTEASIVVPWDEAVRDPRDRLQDMEDSLRVLREIHQTLDVVFEAIDAGPLEEDQPKAAESTSGSSINGVADYVLDDREGIVRNEPDAAAREFFKNARIVYDDDDLAFAPARPSLTVLKSVDHLPKGGSGGRGDARKDAEKIAGEPIPLAPVEDLAQARLLLDDEFPHLAAITSRLLTTQVGRAWVKLPNVILLGQPGVAKTRYGRRLAEVLGLKPTVYPCTGQSDAMFGGTNRGWSSGRPCNPAQAIISSGIANPCFVMDEIEKAGQSRNNGNVLDVLINMLEAESSARYIDPYFEAPLDLSAVNWILTANSLTGIPKPLLDRCTIISVPAPGPEHLAALAASILDDLRRERGQDEAWCPDLDGVELQALREHWAGGSLRVLRQLVAAVLTTRDATAPRQ